MLLGAGAFVSAAAAQPAGAPEIDPLWSRLNPGGVRAPADAKSDAEISAAAAPFVRAAIQAGRWPDGIAGEHLGELAGFRLAQLAATDARAAAAEFAALWKMLPAADGADALRAQMALQRPLLQGLAAARHRFDAKSAAVVAGALRDASPRNSALTALTGDAAAWSRRVRETLVAKGGRRSAARCPATSVSLVEANGAYQGIKLTLAGGREIVLTDNETHDGVRMISIAGAVYEPVAFFEAGGAIWRCLPRAGVLCEPWPAANRRAWLEAFFGPAGSGEWTRHQQEARAHLAAIAKKHDSDASPELLARARQAVENPDIDPRFSPDETMQLATRTIAGAERSYGGEPVTIVNAEFARWVGGAAVLEGVAVAEERVRYSLAWVADQDRIQRSELRQAIAEWYKNDATPFRLPLPEAKGGLFEATKNDAYTDLFEAVDRAHAQVRTVALAFDPAAVQADPRVAFDVATDYALHRLLAAARKGAPLDPSALPEIDAVLKDDAVLLPPRASDPAHRELADAAGAIAGVLAGFAESAPPELRGEDGRTPYSASTYGPNLFELAAFRIRLLLDADPALACREFGDAWRAVPKVFADEALVQTGCRALCRAHLLRALLPRVAVLSPRQRQEIAGLVKTVEAWPETQASFRAERDLRDRTVRNRLAGAAKLSPDAPAFYEEDFQGIWVERKDRAVVGVGLQRKNGEELVLAPGETKKGYRLLTLVTGGLEPLARLQKGGQVVLFLPSTGAGMPDWPALPRAAWIDAFYGTDTPARGLLKSAVTEARKPLQTALPPALWQKVEAALSDPAKELPFSDDELDQVTNAVPRLEFLRSVVGPDIAAFLSPAKVVAGRVDFDDRVWASLERACTSTDANERDAAFDALPALIQAEARDWMGRRRDPKADLLVVGSNQCMLHLPNARALAVDARTRAALIEKSLAFLAP